MKISYKVLKSYKDDIKDVEAVAQDLIMHAAEVEGIEYEGENLKDIFIGEVISCEPHPDSEKLNCTKVRVKGNELSIVCGAPNVKAGIKVPVAVVGAQLAADFVIAKTKIRGEVSEGMICSEDELGLIKERQAGILILPDDAPLDMCVRDYFNLDDAILEVDNKAINHRPDLFSHIGVMREVYAIAGEKFDFNFKNIDFSDKPDLGIKNEIPEEVCRYIGVQVNNVENKQSPEYIKEVLKSADCDSKGLLVDVSNYSLYLYGQPTHCFDADKITGSITIRYAKDGEKFTALNDSEYELKSSDIVIADDSGVLALGGVIGGKDSAVSDNTKNIIIEGAHFNQATVRQTGKRLGLRTDSLNVFEKDIIPEMAKRGVSLIVEELVKTCTDIDITAYSDVYSKVPHDVEIDYDLDFINNLIGADYSEKKVLKILENLGIEKKKDKLLVPFWRKDLNYKADIAEEIARIDGYDNIKTTVPRINLGAIVQDDIYRIKNETRDFFSLRGYYDMYTYSFVSEELMNKLGSDASELIPMKNALSEDLTHLKASLIPNLMLSLEKNIREYKDMKLFEIEKVFTLNGESDVSEHYSLAGVITSNNDTAFYEMQNEVSDLLTFLNVSKFEFHTADEIPSFAHSGRTAKIMVRGKQIGLVGEMHPKVAKAFDQKSRIGFFELNADMLSEASFSTIKAKDVSEFQMNNFDINFVVEKSTSGKDIKTAIEKTDVNLIQKVELFDIFESEDKLPGKRSLSFKVYIQSLEKTLDDSVKNELIKDIISRVEKKGGSLR